MTTNETLERPSSLTPETVKSKLQICLTKAEQSIQSLNDAESKLVYNEDNLGLIKLFIENCKSAEKIVDNERVKLKEPYLQGGRAVDDGARLLSTELSFVRGRAQEKYTTLCQEVEKKQREAAAERLRISTIVEQMNNFKNNYAVKIADAKTSAELVALERMINLETANKNRYQEFLQEFADGCKAIRSLLADQKTKVREMEELEKQALKAAENGSDEKIMEIMEKKEVLEAQIAEKRVNIQEEATNQAVNSTTVADVILPTIPKGGRQIWKWEMTDVKAAAKAGLTLLVPDEKKIDEILKEKRNNETEVTENGIRYYIEKRY